MTEANYDPRSNVAYDIEPGMVFEDTRPSDGTRDVVIEHASRDHDIVVFVDMEGDANRDEVTMWDTYDYFEGEVGAGRYELKTDSDEEPIRRGRIGQVYDLLETYEKQSGRTADHKAEAIEEVISILTDDVPDDHNDTIEFDTIDGIGPKAAQNLRDNGFRTKGDVRSASTEAIESVPLMGESNTENLMAEVEQ